MALGCYAFSCSPSTPAHHRLPLPTLCSKLPNFPKQFFAAPVKQKLPDQGSLDAPLKCSPRHKVVLVEAWGHGDG